MNRSLLPADAVVALVSVLLLSTACGEQAEAGAPPSRAAPHRNTTSVTSSALPAVTPAAGELVALPRLRFHVPVGWTGGHGLSFQVSYGRGLDQVVVTDFDGGGSSTLDELADMTAGADQSLTRIGNVEVGGVELFHLTGRDSSGRSRDEYGAVVAGSPVTLDFLLDRSREGAQRRRVIHSVLASITWRR